MSSEGAPVAKIPLLRPQLPPLERLAPFIAQIDERRIYGNWGPMVATFEARLAQRFSVPIDGVTTIANATLGLTSALLAQTHGAEGLCMIPGWTFVASALAAIRAGLIPWFVDVDPISWALEPNVATALLNHAPGRVLGVMPVAPFGAPINVAAWDRFAETTGLAVVIDAAAAYDRILPGHVPTVVSLHATKIFGTGEGAVALSQDAAIIRQIRRYSNFGFAGARLAGIAGQNAKMSEYTAAIGLAMLDMWEERRAALSLRAGWYQQQLNGSQAQPQLGFGNEWLSQTLVLALPKGRAAELAKALANAGVETRQWWEGGAHDHPATRHFPRTPLPITTGLEAATLGVPFHIDLTEADVAYIARVTNQTVASLNP